MIKVLVVGAGIGGLATAVACRRQGLDVEIFEKAAEILPVGAGIQVPPNAARILKSWGLGKKFLERGAVELSDFSFKRYEDGRFLLNRPGGERMIEDYGESWYVIHRADYHMLLLAEAQRLGAKLRLGAEVIFIETSKNVHVALQDQQIVYGDVIVAADGLWSACRNLILETDTPAKETGDLAYRGSFSAESLKELNDEKVNELIGQDAVTLWLGPDKHCVFYPMKNRTSFNLVLLRPDDLPAGTRTANGDVMEMRKTFEGWDPVLTVLISRVSSVLKWKLLHLDELECWTKGSAVLIGDASHPTLPYLAQGAAMAVEDGAVLGDLLGHFSRSSQCASSNIPSLLQLFESLRKKRTTNIVQGANQNRKLYHMHDGPEQRARDETLAKVTWKEKCQWTWADIEWQKDLLCFDVESQTKAGFTRWLDGETKG